MATGTAILNSDQFLFLSFPLFSKISVKGGDIDPLYQYLTDKSPFKGPIKWNFTKFLVSPDGRIIGRFEPNVDPASEDVVKQIEAALPKAA